MSDQYFKDKAIEIRNKIYDSSVDNKKTTVGDIDDIIYLSLKEVARDQRYACVDAFHNYNLSRQCFETYVEGIIQNTSIEIKK